VPEFVIGPPGLITAASVLLVTESDIAKAMGYANAAAVNMHAAIANIPATLNSIWVFLVIFFFHPFFVPYVLNVSLRSIVIKGCINAPFLVYLSSTPSLLPPFISLTLLSTLVQGDGLTYVLNTYKITLPLFKPANSQIVRKEQSKSKSPITKDEELRIYHF